MKRIMVQSCLFLFFLLISYVCYAQLFGHGFIFEEWQRHAEVQVLRGILPREYTNYSWVDIVLGKGRVLGAIITNAILLRYGNTAAPFAILGILGHAINAYLLFFIAKKIFGKDIHSFFVSLFFLTVPIWRESLSYFAATVETVYAMTFYLLSLFLVLRFVESKRKVFLFGSVLLWYISLQFKLSTSFFAIVIALVAGVGHQFVPVVLSLFGIAGAITVGFVRYSAWYQALYGSGGFAPAISLVNALLYPLITISHFIIPQRFFVRLGTQYISNHYPALGWIPSYVYEFIYSSFAVDIMSLLFGTIIWVVIAVGFLYSARKRLGIFLIGLYILSFLPIAVAQQQRSTGFLESRYYYAVGPAFILLFTYVAQVWWRRLIVFVSGKGMKRITAYFFVACFMLFVAKNVSVIRRELVDTLVVSGRMRDTVSQIRLAHPNIPPNPIFYMEGGQDVFTHFGTGYMLALLYPDATKIPKSIYLIGKTESPLYWKKGIGNKDFEGYLEEEETGVGFFFRQSSLKAFIEKHPDISPEQLVGFVLTDGKSIRAMTPEQLLAALR